MLTQKVHQYSHPVTISDDRQFSTDPHSNTGSDSQSPKFTQPDVEVRVDAVTLLWVKRRFDDLDGVLWRFLGIEVDRVNHFPRKIGVLWDRNYATNTGCLLSERDTENGITHCRLAISGEDCARVSNAKLRGFLRWAKANLWGVKCSRVDIAIDDFLQHLDVSQIEKEIREGNYSGFQKSSIIENFGSKHSGWTVYLGSRSGEKMVRIYDKHAESEGKIKSIRWETEFKGDTANAVYHLLIEFPDDAEKYQAKLINLAVSCVSFIEKIDKNVDRNQLVQWWSDWLKFLEAVDFKVRVARIKTTIKKKREWVKRSFSKSIAMLKIAMADTEFTKYMADILEFGKTKIENIDNIMIRDYVRGFDSRVGIVI
jgi:DNA relaxase NicK